MKEFFKKYSYNMVRLAVNQIAIAVFGLVLAIAAGRAESVALQIISSCGAVIFYLFLLYAAMWDTGSKDRPSIEAGRFKKRPLMGLYIALVANTPNIILAVLYTVCLFAADGSVISDIGAISGSIALFIEGMYTGLLALDFAGVALNTYWWSYFVIIIPSLVICTLAYYFGIKDYHLTKILIPTTPEEEEIKREKKRKRKEQ